MEPGQSDVADAQSSVKQEPTEADAQKEPLHTNDGDCSVSSENASDDDDELMKDDFMKEIEEALLADIGDLQHPRNVWSKRASRCIPDTYGYGRIPAF